MTTLEAVGGGAAALAIIIALVVAATILWESRRPRRRAPLADAGRPEPRTVEDWRRAAERSSAASLGRRWAGR